MADNARPPVAVRIVRPYDSEDAFLENELETVGKTSLILIGAHPRPTGVILRFEVTLSSGATVLRGEGRVLAHKESAFRGQPGLALRFTRLDPKSKALVDRAAAIREARLSGEVSAVESVANAPSSAPEPKRDDESRDTSLDVSESTPDAPAPPSPVSPIVVAAQADPPPREDEPSSEKPRDRESLLAKLRQRASRLSEEQRSSILRLR